MNYLVIPIMLGLTVGFSLWDERSVHGNFVSYLPGMFGVLLGYVYALDCFLYSRIKGFSATLTLPIIYSVFEFSIDLFNPIGSGGTLPYSQLSFLPFAQLASLTGRTGMTFMITWFGSIVYWIYNSNENFALIKKRVKIYAIVLTTILLFGGVRLTFDNINSSVKVSGVHTTDRTTVRNFIKEFREDNLSNARKISRSTLDNLITATKQEAKSGSKFVIWSEVAILLLKEDEKTFITELQSLSDSLDIYLLVNPFIPNKNSRWENKLIAFSPDGQQLFVHYKYGGNFVEGTVKGDQKLRIVETPYGKITGIICWDADFPSTIRQVSTNDVDILFISAADWKGIVPTHNDQARFRAIENGCSIVRQTLDGVSFIADSRGRYLHKVNHFQTDEWVLSGYVPDKRVPTLYSIIGDLFGWLSILALFFIIVLAMNQSKNTKSNTTTNTI
ncbi:MAG: nitrilase-related carbon-nitrogen hydrolase [Flavobacteriaceae bacterium]